MQHTRAQCVLLDKANEARLRGGAKRCGVQQARVGMGRDRALPGAPPFFSNAAASISRRSRRIRCLERAMVEVADEQHSAAPCVTDLRASSAYDVLFGHAFLIKERRGATFGANTVQNGSTAGASDSPKLATSSSIFRSSGTWLCLQLATSQAGLPQTRGDAAVVVWIAIARLSEGKGGDLAAVVLVKPRVEAAILVHACRLSFQAQECDAQPHAYRGLSHA